MGEGEFLSLWEKVAPLASKDAGLSTGYGAG
jgi:hypothetical protein